jgi:EpsI family protein
VIGFRSRIYGIAVVLWVTAGLAVALRPHRYVQPLPARLDQLIPGSFGEWHEVKDGPVAVDPSVVTAGEGHNISQPYDDVLMRSYMNGSGQLIQLALAYSRLQSQEIKIHRPDRCYFAQGFVVSKLTLTPLPGVMLEGRPAEGGQMLAQQPGRTEAVSFLMRIGNVYSSNPWAIRYRIFVDGLAGNIDDGFLMRASQIIRGRTSETADSYDLQGAFLAALIDALPDAVRQKLVH